MDPAVNHYIAAFAGGGPFTMALIVMLGYKGNPSSLIILLTAFICLIFGAAGQYLFDTMTVTYQVLNDAGRIEPAEYTELVGDAKFWGQIISTTNISLGVGLLVAYFAHQQPQKCSHCDH